MNYDDLGKSYAPKSVFANHYESFEIPWKKKEEFTFAQPPINISEHNENNTAKFTIDFLTVKNLNDGNEVYLEWGKGPGNRTKTVTVVDGVADFTGESVQQEIEMKRDKKFPEYWSRRGIEIKLVHSGKQSMFNKSKNNVAVMRIDFGRLTDCFKTDFVRNFDIWASNEDSLVAPEIHYLMSCSWSDPECLRKERDIYFKEREEKIDEEEKKIQHNERVKESEKIQMKEKQEVKEKFREGHHAHTTMKE